MITRRRLLKGMGTAFIGLSTAKLGSTVLQQPRVFEETRRAMGGPFRITAIGSDPWVLRSSVRVAFEEVWRLERLMTIYQSDSEISRLNQLGETCLSSESMEVLRKSIFYSHATGGAFDITLGNYQNLALGFDSARFMKQDMGVDLGGIGIGYAVDQAIKVLKNRGVRSALVDGGGEVKSIGSKKDGVSWRVGIRNPFEKTGFSSIITLDDSAVSTSADYIKPHIIDPRTGKKPMGLASATIVSADAISADALSTAAFVLGLKSGLKLIEKTPGVEGLLVTTVGEIIESSGFGRYTV